jgi:hypothetical protein
MSLEVFGDDDDNSISAEELYDRGWESDEDGVKWWREGDPDNTCTFDEAVRATEDWLHGED